MQSLHRLVYAEDMVVFAYTRDELQKLLAIRGSEGDQLGLSFSGEMLFDDLKGAPLKI